MISDYLETGREHAISSTVLCSVIGCSRRQLQAAVARERAMGIPICADCGYPPGYFLARDQDEMKAYCEKLRYQGGRIFKSRRDCIRMINSLPVAAATEDSTTAE